MYSPEVSSAGIYGGNEIGTMVQTDETRTSVKVILKGPHAIGPRLASLFQPMIRIESFFSECFNSTSSSCFLCIKSMHMSNLLANLLHSMCNDLFNLHNVL